MSYLELCDGLYESWLKQDLELPPDVLRHLPNKRGEATDYSPEPYLVFGDLTNPLAVLTTNPGDGEPFQRLDAVGGEGVPFQPEPYHVVAPRLGQYYSDDPSITQTARSRVRSMLDVANRLGKTGVIQFQLLPFHSTRLDKKRLPDLLNDPTVRDYVDTLSSHLRSFDSVLAMANVFLPAEGKVLVESFARVMGVEPRRLEVRPLRYKDGRPTIGLLRYSDDSQLRAIWCSGAYNQMPGRELRESFIDELVN